MAVAWTQPLSVPLALPALLSKSLDCSLQKSAAQTSRLGLPARDPHQGARREGIVGMTLCSAVWGHSVGGGAAGWEGCADPARICCGGGSQTLDTGCLPCSPGLTTYTWRDLGQQPSPPPPPPHVEESDAREVI